jgi:hypothetical protein
LPGVLTDYHFAIQGCVGRLWERRRDEPAVLKDVERLSFLDIQLVEAQPDLFDWDSGEKTSLPLIAAFSYLIRLYSREGYVREALEVANRAARLNQLQADRDALQNRFACLETEDPS